MTGSRQDGWSQDEDVYLAEVVLRHIREGSTQLKAFEEVGKGLSRTPAACGFRWNSYVRKQYLDGIELAKKARKEFKKSMGTAEGNIELSEHEVQLTSHANEDFGLTLTMDKFIAYLIDLKSRLQEQSFHSVEDLLREYSKLKKHEDDLIQERKTLEIRFKQVEKDYHGLLNLLNRARQLSEES